jgi:hypothetical protein
VGGESGICPGHHKIRASYFGETVKPASPGNTGRSTIVNVIPDLKQGRVKIEFNATQLNDLGLRAFGIRDVDANLITVLREMIFSYSDSTH